MFSRSTKKIIFAAVALTIAQAGQAESIWMTGNDGSTLFSVDSTNGASTQIGSFGQSSTYALAFSGAGSLYGLSNGFNDGTLVTVNTATGSATTVGASTGISDLMALAFSPNGTLYAASWSTDSLYTLNQSTGAASLVGNLGFGGVMDIDFDSNGNLFGLSSSLYKINTQTGQGSLVTGLANSCLMGMAIDSTDHFFATDYCNSSTPLYQINTANGALTNLGNTGIANSMGGAIAPVAVPEPSTIALLGLALMGMVFSRPKKKTLST